MSPCSHLGELGLPAAQRIHDAFEQIVCVYSIGLVSAFRPALWLARVLADGDDSSSAVALQPACVHAITREHSAPIGSKMVWAEV